MALAFKPGTVVMYDDGPHTVVADAENVMVYDPRSPDVPRGDLLLCDLAIGQLWYPTGEEIAALRPSKGSLKNFQARVPKAKHPRVKAFTVFCATRGWRFQDVATEIFGCTRARLHQCLSEYKPCKNLRTRIEALTPEIVHAHPWEVSTDGHYGFEANPKKRLKYPADYRGEAKTCTVCARLWPITAEYYPPRQKGGFSAQCRDCLRTYNRVYYGRQRTDAETNS